MLLINPLIVILQGTGSQVTPGFPHSQVRLRVASPKVREHSRTTPVAYELALDTYYGLGVVTLTPSLLYYARMLRYCRNVRPTWVKFDSKDTKESDWVFEVLSTKSKKRT